MSGRRILVIEDEPQVQDVIRLSLEDFGFELHAITSVAEVEAAVRDLRPDLILVDQTLPEMDGEALCQEMKSHSAMAEIPLVLLASRPAEEGVPEEADARLVKPFRPVSLLNTIYRCLKVGSGAGGG